MKFHTNGIEHIIRGDSSLRLDCISFRAMLKIIKHEGSGMLVEFSGHQTEPLSETIEVRPFLQDIIQKYDPIFQPISSLPPLIPKILPSPLRKVQIQSTFGPTVPHIFRIPKLRI